MRINQRWHQIFGTHEDVVLSHPVDCNAYGIETSDGLVLFDAGTGIDPVGQRTALSAAGFSDGPRHLFLTHGHADHSGGTAALAEYSRATIHAGPLTAQWLAAGDEAKVSLSAARRAGVYPAAYDWRAISLDHIVANSVPILIGDVEITPLATPGHSADHLSYLVKAEGQVVLVAGDAIFAGGTILLQDTWDSSVADSCASIRRLSALQLDAILPGHGPAVWKGAQSDIAKAMQRIDRLLPPANFI